MVVLRCTVDCSTAKEARRCECTCLPFIFCCKVLFLCVDATLRFVWFPFVMNRQIFLAFMVFILLLITLFFSFLVVFVFVVLADRTRVKTAVVGARTVRNCGFS